MRTKAWTGYAPGKSPHVRQGYGRTGLAGARRGHDPGEGRRALRGQSQRGEGAAARLPRRGLLGWPFGREGGAVKRGGEGGRRGRHDRDQLLGAVLDDLKGAASHPGSKSNRRKCELGERLRAATGLPLREVTAFLRISKSSYEYWRTRLGRPDRHAALRARELFEEGSRNWGYRTIWARLRREGTRASEEVVRRLIREESLEVVCNRRRGRWSSYAGEVWVTDITEFRIPAGKAYLSAVVDCFDGRPAGWRIGPSPTAALANGSLADAVARVAEPG